MIPQGAALTCGIQRRVDHAEDAVEDLCASVTPVLSAPAATDKWHCCKGCQCRTSATAAVCTTFRGTLVACGQQLCSDPTDTLPALTRGTRAGIAGGELGTSYTSLVQPPP